jgi:hypothetical protein
MKHVLFALYAIFVITLFMCLGRFTPSKTKAIIETEQYQVIITYENGHGKNLPNLFREDWYECIFDNCPISEIESVYQDYIQSKYPNVPIYKVKIKFN